MLCYTEENDDPMAPRVPLKCDFAKRIGVVQSYLSLERSENARWQAEERGKVESQIGMLPSLFRASSPSMARNASVVVAIRMRTSWCIVTFQATIFFPTRGCVHVLWKISRSPRATCISLRK